MVVGNLAEPRPDKHDEPAGPANPLNPLNLRGPVSPVSYEQHYGFRESPFTLTANPRFIFDSRAYAGVLDAITRALQRHEPLLVVTGPPGSGKTLMCRAVTGWRDERTLVALIQTPPACTTDLLRLVLDQFGVLSRDGQRSAEASAFELTRALERFLGTLGARDARAVILVDDAHRVSKEVLEGLRSLINFETDTKKLLQIVLVGEPMLADILADPEITQLNQRVTRRHVLGPLLAEEVDGYIEHRLSVALGEPIVLSTLFSARALAAIGTLSNGVPRVINLLCDRSLEAAHSLAQTPVSLAVVLETAEHLNLAIPPHLRVKRRRTRLVAAAVVLLVAAPFGYWMYARDRGSRVPPASESQAVAQPRLETVVGTTTSPAAAATAAPAAPSEPVAVLPAPVAALPAPVAPPEPAAPAPAVASVSDSGQPVSTPQGPAASQQGSAGSGGFIVVASSFQTDWRANALSERVSSELGLPVRVRVASGWRQVVVGPYETREDAEAAREQLRKVDVTEAVVAAAVGRTPSGATPVVAENVNQASPEGTSAAAPAADDRLSAAEVQSLLDRAPNLAQAGNVRALLRLRASAESRWLEEGLAAPEVQQKVREIDLLIEDARQRRLELDARAFDTQR